MNNGHLDKRFSPLEQFKLLFINRLYSYSAQLKQGYSRIGEPLAEENDVRMLSSQPMRQHTYAAKMENRGIAT